VLLHLGIPSSICWGSPARLSFAHRVHGIRIFPGWEQAPTHVSQRVKDDATNNLLIESWLLNVAKLDMAEDYHPALCDYLRKIEVPKAFYDLTAAAPLGDITTICEVKTQLMRMSIPDLASTRAL